MPYQIPLFDVNFSDDELTAVQEVLRSKWISMGPRTEQFEADFSRMLGGSSATAVSSCTAALHLALQILGIGPGDEVIVPSLTFVATVNCVRYVNATPVFADIAGADDLTIGARSIESVITPRTKAIIVMHYAGFPCDMDSILAIACERGLKVVEDAAHAPLSMYRGRRVGTLGDFACFSFFSNKNITTAEGGMLVTRNEEHRQQARRLRSHGMTTLSYDRARGHATSYDVVDVGYNYRLDDLRAALGVVQLKKLEADIARRALLRERYLAGLDGLSGLHIPFLENRELVSNYIFPVVLKGAGNAGRNAVRSRLAEKGIETSVHYPAVHRFTNYRDDARPLPETELAADNLVSLPMYFGLTDSQIDFVVEAVREVLGSAEVLEMCSRGDLSALR